MKNSKTHKTNTTIVSKIRRALRDMQSGQDAIFTYDREFRA
jgi:DNA-binding winged helix-turn-helix (wHTH) protein